MGKALPHIDELTEEELVTSVELAEDIEPNFDTVVGIFEVQADPLLGYGAFGTVHYAVLIAESKTVALKAVSKAATRTAAIDGGSPASVREILYNEALLLEELAASRHRNMLRFHGCIAPHASLLTLSPISYRIHCPPLPWRAVRQLVARHQPCLYRAAALRWW